MKTGKVPENILKRSVLKKLKIKREEVLVHSGIGEDCCVVAPEGKLLVLSTDPITGTAEHIGTFAFHITANDIASSGAELFGMLVTAILPEGSTEEDLKEIISDLAACTQKYNVEIMGGHTEVSAAVNQPIVSVTGVGKVEPDKLVKTSGLKPGNDLVVTKWVGLEGSSILARTKEEKLKEHLPMELISRAQNFENYLSVVKDAKVAMQVGVTAMHDVTEGGIFGALWEMAEASSVGLKVDLKKIPIRQETIEVCEVFDLNPYLLMSSGAMLIGTEHGTRLVEELEKAGISAAVIGYATEGNDRIVKNGDEHRFLEPPKIDELYKV